jgi:hypothetical protein
VLAGKSCAEVRSSAALPLRFGLGATGAPGIGLAMPGEDANKSPDPLIQTSSTDSQADRSLRSTGLDGERFNIRAD